MDPSWFQSYLTDRHQTVRMNNVLSLPHPISYGVSQGSILGPILFLIYINDMSDYLKNCLLVQYADDTQILLTGDIDNVNELLNQAEIILAEAKLYFQNNGLKVNESKTQCIFFGSRHNIARIPNEIEVRFSNSSIKPSTRVKNLGIIMDQYLLYDSHISEITKKITGTLLYINRISDRFEVNTRIMLVQSLAISILNYCLRVWGMTNKTQIERSQKLQNFAAKVAIGGARKFDHVSPIIEKLQWLRMSKKIFMEVCVMVFKHKRRLIPEWLFNFESRGQVRDVRTRQEEDLVVNRFKTDIGKNSFEIIGPLNWNKLPTQIRDERSIHIFKKNLKKFLLSNDS